MDKESINWTELKKFLKKVEEAFPLERAILFGSRVTGNALKESDYDIILVSCHFSGLSFFKRIEILLDMWEMKEELEVLPYTPDEFSRKGSEICVVQEAIKEGIDLL
jgi:predicted nucleotidyltransferase